MEIKTVAGVPISSNLVSNYFLNLINQFFKILPMRENKEDTLDVYMRSLQSELLGCGSLIIGLENNSFYLSLLSTLQFLIDSPECEISEVKREVFKSISICNKLSSLYSESEG